MTHGKKMYRRLVLYRVTHNLLYRKKKPQHSINQNRSETKRGWITGNNRKGCFRGQPVSLGTLFLSSCCSLYYHDDVDSPFVYTLSFGVA